MNKSKDAPKCQKIQCLHPKARVRVVAKDCLEVARFFTAQGKRVIVLNPAHNDIPGGPTNLAGHTLEEQIFKSSQLGSVLDRDSYPIDDEKNGPCLLVTPNVMVTKTQMYQSVMPFRCAFITTAAPAVPPTTTNEKGEEHFKRKEDRKTVEVKIRAMLEAAADYDIFVACAWGLGAFYCPREGMLKAWSRVLDSGCRQPSVVIFAMYGEKDNALYKLFSRLTNDKVAAS
jgi:uncharacterized protein (TIGR02452 family)